MPETTTTTEIEILEPREGDEIVTAAGMNFGEPVPPLVRIKMLSADRWEDFTTELVYHWKTKYDKVVRCGGGGDMGRDVIAYMEESGKWENFQCKHYSSPLSPAIVRLEIGKLLYYVHMGSLTIPEKYYFVCPTGVSGQTLKLLQNPDKLKSELLEHWETTCEKKIATQDIPLTDDLERSIEETDFSIFSHIPPQEILDLHSQTPFYERLFGVLTRTRPPLPRPPEAVSTEEMLYTMELINAFNDAEGGEVNLSDAETADEYKDEFASARRNFYAAESLEKFSRDWLPKGGTYSDLMEECQESIIPTVRLSHANGYQRYLATSSQAAQTDYMSHPLRDYIKVQDKKGLCHQLVNINKFKWVKE